MFQGFGKETLLFFLDLRFHNDKSFMDANRERYIRDVRQPFYDFIGAMAPGMQQISEDMEVRPQKCLSRINRDTRFSADKSPYRDHLWVAFRQSGMPNGGTPFYWFELSPEHVSWGVGIWGEYRSAMDAMRRRMTAHPDDYLRLLKLLKSRDFCLAGDEWKKMKPPDTLPEALRPWYLKKHIYAERLHTEVQWTHSPDIVSRVMEDYTARAPLYRVFRGCAEEAMNQMDEQGGNV